MDYHQITGTFRVTLSGNFLPIEGKTSRCHPNYNFPKEFNITHSENYWLNEEKTKMLNKTVIPYVKKIRKMLGLQSTKQWILVADIFEGQWTPAVKNIIKENNGFMVPIPNNMISYFQPLDLTVNHACKASLQDKAQGWYSNQLQEQLSCAISPDKVSVDVRLNVLKPVHAEWIIQSYHYMQTHKEIIYIIVCICIYIYKLQVCECHY